MMSNAAENLDILEISLILHNYFDNPIKLFSDLYLSKFLDTPQNHTFRVMMAVCRIIFLSIYQLYNF